MDLAGLVTHDDDSVLEIDQIFLFQLMELQKYLVGFVHVVEADDNQIRHVDFPSTFDVWQVAARLPAAEIEHI